MMKISNPLLLRYFNSHLELGTILRIILKINLSLQQDFQAAELPLNVVKSKQIETTLRHVGFDVTAKSNCHR